LNDFVFGDALFDDDAEQMIAILAVKELEDRKRKPQRGSTVGHLCIPRNRALSHDMLMRDYFAEWIP
jgi:hypothetical protein